MLDTKEKLVDYIANNDALDVYYEYLIGQEVWYFNGSATTPLVDYDEFKKFIARYLGVHFNNISIIGSAKTKYSFSPTKDFKEFDDESDFDLIIVSRELYERIWSAYRSIALERSVSGYHYICNSIFNGFISMHDDGETYGNKDLEDWQRLVRTFKPQLQLKFNVKHEVNYRIYSDWESVQNYHLKGISRLKDKINET